MTKIEIVAINNVAEIAHLNIGVAGYGKATRALANNNHVRVVVINGWVSAVVVDEKKPYDGYDQADFDQLGLID